MLDGAIVKTLIAQIKVQLGIYGIADADLRVTRSNQPTAQHAGASTGSKPYQVFIAPVASTQIGWSRDYDLDTIGAATVGINHVKQKSYQISILTDFDPATMTVLPAHDVAQILNDMIQQPDSIRALKAGGVNIQQCTDVRPSFELNESEQWQSMPSFDITVSYNATYTKPIPAIIDTAGDIDRV